MTRSSTWIIVIASLFGFSSLLMGAIGAHVLHNPPSWQSAVHTQTIHALFLIGLAALREHLLRWAFAISCALAICGVVLFSGSIYVKVLLELENGTKLAPYGGSMLMLAWLCMGVGALRRK